MARSDGRLGQRSARSALPGESSRSERIGGFRPTSARYILLADQIRRFRMRRRCFLGSSVGLVGGGLLAGLAGDAAETASGIQHHLRTVSVMTDTANRFLGTL